MAVILRNLPDTITKHLSTEFRQATNIEHVQSIVTTHLHDYRTRPPRGITGTMLYLTEPQDSQDPPDDRAAAGEDQERDQEVLLHGVGQDEDGLQGDGQRDRQRDQQRDHEDEVLEEPPFRAAEIGEPAGRPGSSNICGEREDCGDKRRLCGDEWRRAGCQPRRSSSFETSIT